MSKIELGKKAVNSIAPSREKLIGYLFSGFLVLMILAVEQRNFTKSLIDSLSPVLAGITFFALGVGLYSIYFRVLGELFLYPIQHALHMLVDRITGRPPERSTSTIRYILYCGVPLIKCRSAYEAIKSSFFDDKDSIEIQTSHGELHSLYFTSIAAFATALWKYVGSLPHIEFYFWTGIIMLIAALVSDTRQHSKEASLMRSNKEQLIGFLRSHGFVS